MATVIRPPFFVPRPAEEQFWSKLPVRSPIIPFLTKQKIYGAGGEVPTTRWNDNYTENVAESFWYARPRSDSAPIQLTNTQVKMYGQRGQAPTKRWNALYTENVAESFWQATTYHNKTLVVVTINPFSVERKNDYYDDVSGWLVQYVNRNQSILTPTLNPFTVERWSFNYDDISVQSGGPSNSSAIQILMATKIVVEGAGGVIVVETPRDVYYTVRNRPNMLLGTLTSIKPFVNVSWDFNYDDTPAWQRSAANPTALSLVPYRMGNQYFNFIDDASTWSATTNQNLLIKTPSVAKPFVSVFWKTADDPALWSGSPIDSASIQLLTFQRMFGAGGQVSTKQWHYDYDDLSPWLAGINRNLSIATPTAKPFVNVFWKTTDDSSAWSGSPSNSAVITFLTKQVMFGKGGQVPAKQWHYDYDDASAWFPWINRDLALTQAIIPKPFVVVNWNNYDDSAIWQPARYRNLVSITPQPPPFFAKQARYDYDDQYVWQSVKYHNAVLTPPIAAPFTGRGWNFVSPDPLAWQPTQVRNAALAQPAQPFIGREWSFIWDDLPSWQLKSSAPIVLTAFPFAVRGWNRISEDPAAWQWRPSSQRVLYLIGPFKIYNTRKFNYYDPPVWPGFQINTTIRQIFIPGSIPFPGAGQLLLTTFSPILTSDHTHHWRVTINLKGGVDNRGNLQGNVGSDENLQGNVDLKPNIKGG